MKKNKFLLLFLVSCFIGIQTTNALSIKVCCYPETNEATGIKCYSPGNPNVEMKCMDKKPPRAKLLLANGCDTISIPGDCPAKGTGVQKRIEYTGEDSAIVYFTSDSDLTASNNPVTCSGVSCQISYNGNQVVVHVSKGDSGCSGSVNIVSKLTSIETECRLGQKFTLKIDGVAVDGGTVSQPVSFGECGTVGTNCCTEGEQISPDATFIKHNVVNCCSEGTKSIAEQYNLQDLFCDDNETQTKQYFPKCNSDNYKSEVNSYCDLYCTQRAFVDAPGASGDYGPVNAGRFFSLPTNDHGTKSPYLFGAKRCRLRIKYAEWNSTMNDTMSRQAELYNKYQEAMANLKHINDDMIPPSSIGSAGMSVTCYEYDNDGKTVLKSDSSSVTVKYKLYTWKEPATECPIYDQIHMEHDTAHTKMILVKDEVGKKVEVQPPHYELVSMFGDVTAGSGDKGSNSTNMCTQLTNLTRTKLMKAQANNKNVQCDPCTGSIPDFSTLSQAERAEPYNNALEGLVEALQATIDTIKDLKAQMIECLTYFEKEEFEYAFNPSYHFYYTQVYRKDGKLTLDKSELYPAPHGSFDPTGMIKYEDVGDRNFYEDTTGNIAKDIYEDLHSDIYGSGEEQVGGLDGFSLSCKGKSTFSQSIDPFEKLFATDRVRYAEASWDLEESADFITQYPSGLHDGNGNDGNNTSHSGQLPTDVDDLDGTYLIGHDLRGIGEGGMFDKAFDDKKACTGQPSAEVSPLTCKLTIKHGLITTGHCYYPSAPIDKSIVTGNDIEGDHAGSMYKNCRLEENGDYRLFIFQLVDPTDPFPNGLETSKGRIAANWSEADINSFKQDNANNNAYSDDYLSYSFDLTPEVISQIREYNGKQAEDDNGYGDFKFKCGTCSSNVTCSKCISQFLTELAKGSNNFTASWAGKGTIDDLRRSDEGWRENK